MATPNYSYEKRQRELAKKKKKEEKAKKKAGAHEGSDAPAEDVGTTQGKVAPKDPV